MTPYDNNNRFHRDVVVGYTIDMKRPKLFLYLAWIQAWVATLGSLFFSEVMKFPPCKLCWYQRICMYPLVAVLAVGIVKKDKNVYQYVLPLSITGFGIALYHNLIYYHIISESFVPCSQGVSCTTKFFAWFGFITIPLLSLVAFTVISVCMIMYQRACRKQEP